MHHANTVIFNSKKDLILGVILWGPLLAFLIFSLLHQLWLGITISLLGLVFVGVLWFGTKYIVDKDSLDVYIGPYLYARVDLNRINSIKSTRDILSAPALSFDRIEITYNNTCRLVISPANVKEFLDRVKPD